MSKRAVKPKLCFFLFLVSKFKFAMQKFVILVCIHFAVINLQNKQVDAAVAYGKADFSKCK